MVKRNPRVSEKNPWSSDGISSDGVGWMRWRGRYLELDSQNANVDLHRSVRFLIARLSTGIPLTPKETRERNCTMDEAIAFVRGE